MRYYIAIAYGFTTACSDAYTDRKTAVAEALASYAVDNNDGLPDTILVIDAVSHGPINVRDMTDYSLEAAREEFINE